MHDDEFRPAPRCVPSSCCWVGKPSHPTGAKLTGATLVHSIRGCVTDWWKFAASSFCSPPELGSDHVIPERAFAILTAHLAETICTNWFTRDNSIPGNERTALHAHVNRLAGSGHLTMPNWKPLRHDSLSRLLILRCGRSGRGLFPSGSTARGCASIAITQATVRPVHGAAIVRERKDEVPYASLISVRAAAINSKAFIDMPL